MVTLRSFRVLLVALCAILEVGCGRNGTILQCQSEGGKALSPLACAARRGDLAVVKKLLADGVDVNAVGANGATPLQEAVGGLEYSPAGGNIEVVKTLLRAGANVNASGADGYTALHAAAVQREVGVVEVLLAAGADVNARTKNNVTPLMCSIGSPYSDPKISLALIRAGADVNAVSSNGEAVLWSAATGPTEVLEELLKRGANPNVQTKAAGFPGFTPLHMAAMSGLKDEVELLLRYGADPMVRNGDGQTPLDVANPKFPEIKQILSKHLPSG
jgi:ankyrin repeat protein